MSKNFIRVPYGLSVHGNKEIKAVNNVLKNSTQMGKNVYEFEKKIAKLFDKKYGLMVNSGSSAIMLAMESLNLPEGSEVITPALTFSTTVAYIVRNKLVPVFVDVEEGTYCINTKNIEKLITKKTKAIVAPHLMGNIVDWEKISPILKKKKIVILEDSADTLGATYKNKSTGHFADISITSFYGSHIINCAGNGGMVCFNNKKLYEKAKLLRSWGRSSSLYDENSEKIENRFNIKLDGIQYDKKFVFESIGHNLEPSEMGAAFGLVQLSNFSEVKAKRIFSYQRMQEIFKDYSDFVRTGIPHPDGEIVWMHFPFVIEESAPFSRKDVQTFFELRGIQTRPPFSGNILNQPMMKNQKFIANDNYDNANDMMKNGILLGCHQGLSEEQFNHIEEVCSSFFGQYM